MNKLFSSEKGFVFTMAGAAIGLGNIWRFPYLVSNYGGGLFLLLYLFLIVCLGYFLLSAELSFGKTTRKNVYDGTKEIATTEETPNPGIWAKVVGIPPLVTAFMMNIIYLIVMGWVLYYIFQNVLFLSDVSNTPITSKSFFNLTDNYQKQLFWSFLCVLSASWVLCKGTLRHIEKIATTFIPAIFFILVYLIFWTLSQEGAAEGMKTVFKPNWPAFGFTDSGFDIKQFISVLFAALSQILYSLSIGMGVAYIYGTRAPQTVNLASSVKYVIILDTLCAVLAAMFVLGISNAYEIPKDVGFNLTFVSLPIAFEQMIGGSFLMFLFYSVLYLAAFTSLVSHFFPLVTMAEEKFKISRKLAFVVIALADLFLVAIVLLSFTGTPAGAPQTKTLFDLTNTATDTMLLISLFTMSLFIGWVGNKAIYNTFKKQLKKALHDAEVSYIKSILRFITPIILMLIILNTIFNL